MIVGIREFHFFEIVERDEWKKLLIFMIMNRKTYGVETVLHKKRNRPFPKEVVKEVEAGEDLFSALCAGKIKEMKHKAKTEENKGKKKKKKPRELPPHEFLRECSSRDNFMDSFDALMIAPRDKAKNGHSYSSESHLFERLTNIPLRNQNSRNGDDVYKENSKTTCETLQDVSLVYGTNKVNEILSASKMESKVFSKNNKKNNKLKCKTSKIYMSNLLDSDLALLDDSQELESLTNDFIAGKINIRGLKKEESNSKSRKANILLPRNTNEVLHDCMSSEEEESKKEELCLENGEISSNEFLCVFRGGRKMTCKLVNSSPVSCRHLEPDNVLSPILPLLPQCSIDDGECTERAKSYVGKLSLESESLLPVPRLKDFDSEQNGKETLRRESSSPYYAMCKDRRRRRRSNYVDNEIISPPCRLQSPDPFSDSGDEIILNNLERSVLPSTKMEEHSKEAVSINKLCNLSEKCCSISSIAVHDRVDGCSPALRGTSLTIENSVNVLCIMSQRHLNSVEFDQNGSVLVPLEKSLEGYEKKTDKSETKASYKLQFSSTPNHELAPVIERSSLLKLSIQKLAPSFSRRSSHVVLPLAQHDDLQKFSGFRDVYTSSCVMGPTHLNYAIEESCLDDKSNEEITFKDVVLGLCEQTEILNVVDVFYDCDFAESKKIGEGVYGEVYSRTNSDGISSVLKIMPIEGNCEINGEPQKKYEEILPEIVITRELSNLRANEMFGTSNFPELIRCWCVQGTYPSKLLKLWHKFDEEKGSENDSPENFADDQIYIILELTNVGCAMEGFTFSSSSQALSVFMQVANALAAAEAAFEFEHRDLHWGNILIKKTKKRSLPWKLYGEEHHLQTFGIQATVIDFTLSRITLDGCCIYNDLANDPALFEGQDDYQFDIYRLMRNETGNNWEVFKPYNNVLWLSYVLEKLISGVKYHKKPGKKHKNGMIKLQQLRKEIIDFESAVDVALSLKKKY